jgi:hypothetical protein
MRIPPKASEAVVGLKTDLEPDKGTASANDSACICFVKR